MEDKFDPKKYILKNDESKYFIKDVAFKWRVSFNRKKAFNLI